MARVTLGTGEFITVGGDNTEIFGTSGAQNITVLDGSTVIFRSGFNSGGDTVRLSGKASDFQLSFIGSNVTFQSVTDGITVVIPIGVAANTIVFDNGDTRTLSLVGGVPTLSGQSITGTPTFLEAGPGVYEVTSASEVLEGGVIQFTVTRTDTEFPETLNATVLGGTNDGTVTAATPGADFTVAGGTLVFAAGQASATFTVSATNDAVIEGLEGLTVRVLNSDQQVVATSTGLILDATPEGQTFQLTPGLDQVGTGSPTDLIGSAGNNGTNGNDTIIAITGEVSLLNPNLGLTGALTPFDVINGGNGDDILLVLDNGNTFTSAPNFTGVTISNVEMLDYRAPTRGFLGQSLNTTTFAGLEMATVFINGDDTEETLTLGAATSAVLTQIGDADVAVEGGGGTLVVNAPLTGADGNVTVGGTTLANAFTSVTVSGGDIVEITDRGTAQLTTVNIVGADDDINIRGGAVATVNVSGLNDDSFGNRDVDVDGASVVTVNLSNIDLDGVTNPAFVGAGAQNLDIQSETNLIVNTNGTVFGLNDLETKGNSVTLNNSAGSVGLDDISVLGVNATVNIISGGSSVVIDDIDGGDENGVPNVFGDSVGDEENDVRNVNISGAGSVSINSVQQADNTLDTKTTITSTNGGGVTIDEQLGDDVKFNGSGNTGDDDVTFGATTEDNTFGGGDDLVTFNSDAFGTDDNGNAADTSGSFDGGDGIDTLAMESNNAAAFTEDEQEVTNFETLFLTGQDLAKADLIDLHNIGLDTVSNVISNVGAGSEPEITRVKFSGEATGSDEVRITGANGLDVTVVLEDDLDDLLPDNGDNAVAIALAVVDAVDNQNGYTAELDPSDNTAVIITGPTGVDANVAVSFTDDTTIGSPGLEQTFGIQNENGRAFAAEVPDTALLELTSVTVLPGQTFSIQYNNVDGTDGTFIFTNGLETLTQEGGTLAAAIVAAANSDGDFNDNVIATRVGNNVLFTALPGQTDGDTSFVFTGTNNALTAGLDVFNLTNTKGSAEVTGLDEDAVFILDGVASGDDRLVITLRDNDPSTADETIEVQFDDGDVYLSGGGLRAEVIAAINAQSSLYNASVYGGGLGLPAFYLNNGILIESVNDENLPNLVAANFNFIDDDNVDTPGAAVTVLQQGTVSSVTLENFIAGSTLTLLAANGDHTVLLKDDGDADVLDIVLGNDGDHGVVTANEIEKVNISTENQDTNGELPVNNPGPQPVEGDTDVLLLESTDLEEVVVSGSDGLALDTTSAVISSIDASGERGFFSWSADAIQDVDITVRTGSGGSRLDFSLMQIQGGVSSTGDAPVTVIGGSGNDFIITGDQDTSRGTITTGGGRDSVVVGIVDGGNDFWTITDFDDDGTGSNNPEDLLLFEAAATLVGQVQLLEPTAIFQDYLDAAARGNTADGNFVAGGVSYFYYKGDTYVVQDNSDSEDFIDGSDTVIRLDDIKVIDAINIGQANSSDVPAELPSMMSQLVMTDFTVI